MLEQQQNPIQLPEERQLSIPDASKALPQRHPAPKSRLGHRLSVEDVVQFLVR